MIVESQRRSSKVFCQWEILKKYAIVGTFKLHNLWVVALFICYLWNCVLHKLHYVSIYFESVFYLKNVTQVYFPVVFLHWQRGGSLEMSGYYFCLALKVLLQTCHIICQLRKILVFNSVLQIRVGSWVKNQINLASCPNTPPSCWVTQFEKIHVYSQTP